MTELKSVLRILDHAVALANTGSYLLPMLPQLHPLPQRSWRTPLRRWIWFGSWQAWRRECVLLAVPRLAAATRGVRVRLAAAQLEGTGCDASQRGGGAAIQRWSRAVSCLAWKGAHRRCVHEWRMRSFFFFCLCVLLLKKRSYSGFFFFVCGRVWITFLCYNLLFFFLPLCGPWLLFVDGAHSLVKTIAQLWRGIRVGGRGGLK